MKMHMTRLTARKKTEINRIKALCEIKTREKRDDIVWLLQNYTSLSLTSGEGKNLERYLEVQFGLLKNGYPTAEGQSALRNGMVFTPQFGIFRLFYLENEPVVGKTTVIGNEPVQPSKNFEAFEKLDNFNELEGTWASWFKHANKLEFLVHFEREGSNIPVITREDPLQASIEITMDDSTAIMCLTTKGNVFTHESKMHGIHMDANLGALLKDWDRNCKCVKVSIDEVRTEEEKKHFKTTRHFNDASLIIDSETDASHYEITIQELPIRPKNLSDAEKWLLALLLDEVSSQHAYITSSQITAQQEQLLKRHPLQELHPTLKVQSKEIVFEHFRKHKQEYLVREVIVADDLF